MHFSNLLATGLLAMSAVGVMSQPLDHQHIHKRDNAAYVTVKVTKYVDANGNELPQPTPTVADVPAVAATTAPSVNTLALVNDAVAVPVPTTIATSFVTSASAAAASSSVVSVGAAGVAGISYSPYNADGTCKSTSDVASDLAKLSAYPMIRIYGVDCNQVANVLAALSPGQKLFVGIFDVTAINSALDTIASAVSTYSSWSVIDTISVGNELVNSGQQTAAEMVALTSQARTYAKSLGFTGSVVTVDTFIAVINNPTLCDASDYITVNAHPFFDGYVTADQAGDWVLLQIQRVWSACGSNKRVFITESGWPSQGDNNNVAVPSESNQATAIASIKEKAGDSTILFTAFNDLWKAPGSLNVEQFWGILN